VALEKQVMTKAILGVLGLIGLCGFKPAVDSAVLVGHTSDSLRKQYTVDFPGSWNDPHAEVCTAYGNPGPDQQAANSRITDSHAADGQWQHGAVTLADFSGEEILSLVVLSYYVDAADGNDLNDGLSPETAFATIQRGINQANDGDTVLVYPGVYTEELDFLGKAITVQSIDEPAVLRGPAPDSYSVFFSHGEDANSIFKNFIVRDSDAGFVCLSSSPTISHLTVVDCNAGGVADEGANPTITNSIFHANTDGGLFGCEATYSSVTYDITGGLVSHWTFEQGSGSTAYDSAGNNNGTLKGDPQWMAGKIGEYALDFDGEGDYVEIADDDSLNPSNAITICWWLYNRGGRSAGIYKYASCPGEANSPGNSRAYELLVDDSTLKARLTIFSSVSDSDFVESYNTVSLNDWHHVAGTFEQGSSTIYIDGYLDDYVDMSVSSIMNDVQPLIIGGHWQYCGTDRFVSMLNGMADDVRIYNRALSAPEIQQLYSKRKGAEPMFVDADNGDYHLKSEGWRWSQSEQQWVFDDVTSPCIDAGNPGTPLGNEPMSVPRDPNNIWGKNVRVNMGAYGGTSQASIGPHGWALLADLNNDGTVDFLDVGLWAQYWLDVGAELPGDLDRNGTVNMADFALLGQDYSSETIWR
jgi:hypothetical protein